ncbi:hypothetical protein Tco_0622952 [Tanacetum coccineum]
MKPCNNVHKGKALPGLSLCGGGFKPHGLVGQKRTVINGYKGLSPTDYRTDRCNWLRSDGLEPWRTEMTWQVDGNLNYCMDGSLKDCTYDVY